MPCSHVTHTIEHVIGASPGRAYYKAASIVVAAARDGVGEHDLIRKDFRCHVVVVADNLRLKETASLTRGTTVKMMHIADIDIGIVAEIGMKGKALQTALRPGCSLIEVGEVLLSAKVKKQFRVACRRINSGKLVAISFCYPKPAIRAKFDLPGLAETTSELAGGIGF